MFDRARLAEYLRVVPTQDIKQEEMNIIFGALELSQKTAQEIMTRIEDVFMLPYDALLDFETIAEIGKYTYNALLTIIIIIILIELAFVHEKKTFLITILY